MYSITLTNRNGYTISRKFKTITACKEFASYYPLSVFFGWIYNTKTDEMCYYNDYTDKWEKCNNETFKPYWAY